MVAYHIPHLAHVHLHHNYTVYRRDNRHFLIAQSRCCEEISLSTINIAYIAVSGKIPRSVCLAEKRCEAFTS